MLATPFVGTVRAGMGQEKLSIKFVVGYIEISTAERVYDYLSMYEGLHTEGSFVGHGVVNGQNVKLSGEAGDDPATTGIYRVSTDGMVIGEPNQHTNSPLFFL